MLLNPANFMCFVQFLHIHKPAEWILYGEIAYTCKSGKQRNYRQLDKWIWETNKILHLWKHIPFLAWVYFECYYLNLVSTGICPNSLEPEQNDHYKIRAFLWLGRSLLLLILCSGICHFPIYSRVEITSSDHPCWFL